MPSANQPAVLAAPDADEAAAAASAAPAGKAAQPAGPAAAGAGAAAPGALAAAAAHAEAAEVAAAGARAAPAARVAVDLRALVPVATGIGVYTAALTAELARRGGMRYLGVAHREPRGAAELAAAGVEIETQPAPLGVIWQQLVLPRRLRRGDVDLLWSPLITLPLACPVPAVATVHDLTVLSMPAAHRAKVRLSLLPFLRGSFAGARRLVTISQAVATELAFHYPGCADRIRVVHAGVGTAFRPAAAEEIATTREELGAPNGYILYAGTLEPRKNVGALLDAWEALADDDPAFPPLVLAGPYGWGSRALARRIERRAAPAASSAHGSGTAHRGGGTTHNNSGTSDSGGAAAGRHRPRLLALGHLERDHLVRIFQAARLFVYPSLAEGFGLPAAEAIACGVPVVALDTSSLPEVVGDAGLLVEPGDTGALAAAIGRVIADAGLAADLAARAAARTERFRWDRAAAEMEEVFREALE
jgi:glycosyltransferase involved in cell wall biosynthesis